MGTHIIFILDRSGSMNSIAAATIAGFNSFVADQQSALPDAALTLVLFNERRQIVYARQHINKVAILTSETFIPAGDTALLDAIGETLVQESEDTAERVIAILTDGLENASRRFSREQVFELIRKRQENGWQFLFLGANQDAIKECGSLGIDAGSCVGFAHTGDGVSTAFASASSFIQSFGDLVKPKSKPSLSMTDTQAKLLRQQRRQRGSKN